MFAMKRYSNVCVRCMYLLHLNDVYLKNGTENRIKAIKV